MAALPPGIYGLNSTYCRDRFRLFISDLDASQSGRWTDAAVYHFIDAGNKRIVRDVLFPDSRVVQPTVANVQLYQFPLMLRTDRVFVGGQLVVPSDLPTLAGEQILAWDRSGTGQNPPGPYADIPPNSGSGIAAPGWTVTSPLSYPTTQGQWQYPTPDAQPWYCGSTPRLYWRGGWLGIDPIPTNSDPTTTIAIDGVVYPFTITAAGQSMTTPGNFLDAITWAAIGFALFGDSGARSAQMRKDANDSYTVEKRQLLKWLTDYPGKQRDGPKVNTLRPMYSQYRTRRNRGGRGYYS